MIQTVSLPGLKEALTQNAFNTQLQPIQVSGKKDRCTCNVQCIRPEKEMGSNTMNVHIYPLTYKQNIMFYRSLEHGQVRKNKKPLVLPV